MVGLAPRWNGSYPEFPGTGGYRTLYLLSGQQTTNTATVMHVGARHYSPSLRRWLQRDPIDLLGANPNLYAYCSGNAVNLVDAGGTRALTPRDITRLRSLYNWVYWQDNLELNMRRINCAVAQIKALIAVVPDGSPDPPNLMALWWAIDRLGNTSYALSGSLAMGHGFPSVGAGQWKCNAFVCNAYVESGAAPVGPSGMPRLGRTNHPPGANEWAKDEPIGGFVPTYAPVPGYIVGFGSEQGRGHAGIYLGGSLLVYAGSECVQIGWFGKCIEGKDCVAIHRVGK